jgi:hypothetical protein
LHPYSRPLHVQRLRSSNDAGRNEIGAGVIGKLPPVNRWGCREKPHVPELISRAAMFLLLVTGRSTMAHSIK